MIQRWLAAADTSSVDSNTHTNNPRVRRHNHVVSCLEVGGPEISTDQGLFVHCNESITLIIMPDSTSSKKRSAPSKKSSPNGKKAAKTSNGKVAKPVKASKPEGKKATTVAVDVKEKAGKRVSTVHTRQC